MNPAPRFANLEAAHFPPKSVETNDEGVAGDHQCGLKEVSRLAANAGRADAIEDTLSDE
jgi:hypothetical protein